MVEYGTRVSWLGTSSSRTCSVASTTSTSAQDEIAVRAAWSARSGRGIRSTLATRGEEAKACARSSAPRSSTVSGVKTSAGRQYVGRIRFAGAHLQPVEPRLLAEVGTAGHAGVPQHELKDGAAARKRMCGQEGAHPQPDERDVCDARCPHIRNCLDDAVEPRVDLADRAVVAGRIAGAGVVEPQRKQTVSRQPVSENPKCRVGRSELDTERRTDHHGPPSNAIGGLMNPSQQPAVALAEPRWRARHVAPFRSKHEAPLTTNQPRRPRRGG